MTFTRFIVKSSFRNKRRSILTVLSIGFSLFLLIVLRSVLNTLLNPPALGKGDLRLITHGATALGDRLPISYRDTIRKIPHVKGIVPMQWVAGIYKEPKNFFPSFATDADEIWNVYPDFETDEQTKKGFRENKNGAVAQRSLMKKFGFQVGDLITLTTPQFGTDIPLKIVGSFDYAEDNKLLYMRWDYFDEVCGKQGICGTYVAIADAPEALPAVMKEVDTSFRNSAAPTTTETERAFRLSFVSMLGNVQMLLGSIIVVIVFTMLLVTASTMSMTIRERLREVAILKSMGYPRRTVLLLILGEAAFISLLGGAIACLFAFVLGNTDLEQFTQGFIRHFQIWPTSYLMAVAVGAMVGILSGLIPALRASAITITSAMRGLN